MNTTAISTREWLDAVERAKEFANAQSQLRPTDTSLTPMLTNSSTFEDQDEFDPSLPPPQTQSHGGVLSKQHTGSGDSESLKGRKRFSKRQSKSGLTAVF